MEEEKVRHLLADPASLSDAGLLKQLADAARDQNARAVLSSSKELQEYTWPDTLALEAVVEACRLFGNLCYESGAGRSLVITSGIIPVMLTSLRKQSTTELRASRICLVLPSFIQNFVADNSVGIEKVAELLDLLASHTQHQDDAEKLSSYIDLLGLLAEEEEGMVAFSEPVLASCVSMYKLLGEDTDLLNLLVRIAENEKLAPHLINLHTQVAANLTSTCQPTTEIVLKVDVEEKSARELNSELLVILLSQTNGKDLDTGFARDWLASESSLLASTALLVLGNLCTSDEATQALVTEDLLDQCTRLLQRDDQDDRLLHALLGCLRNFCVNPKVRELLAIRGLHSRLLEMSARHQGNTASLLKIVCILRLSVHSSSEVAAEVGDHNSFVANLVNILTGDRSTTSFSAALGQLTVESARLFSSLITATKSRELAGNLLDLGVVPILLSLLSSPHPVLVNQGVLPLCLASSFHPAHPKLCEAMNSSTFDRLANVLDNASMPGEIKENVIKLLITLSQDPAVTAYMKASTTLEPSLMWHGLKCADPEVDKIRETIFPDL